MTGMTSQPNQPFRPASQIALALGVSKRAVINSLRDTPATAFEFVRGQKSPAWALCALPEEMKSRLESEANKRGYRNAEALLECPPRQSQPATPLALWPMAAIENAKKLQSALLPVLECNPDATAAEVERSGLDKYRLAFGHDISSRHLQRLLQRTRKRDAGAEDWSRLELFGDESLWASRREAPQATKLGTEFEHLMGIIRGFSKPAAPTHEEKRFLLDSAFQALNDLAPLGMNKAGKRRLLHFLQEHAAFLATSPAALRRNFDRLFLKWQRKGQQFTALLDARAGRPRGVGLTTEEFQHLVAYAAKFGGGCDQGWRESIREGLLRPEVVNYYAKQTRRCPRKIREQIIEHVRDAKIRLHGPRETALRGPYITRDPNHPANPLASGNWDLRDEDLDVLLSYFEAVFWRGVDTGRLQAPCTGREVFVKRGYWASKNTRQENSRDRYNRGAIDSQVSRLESQMMHFGFGPSYCEAIRKRVTRGRCDATALRHYRAALERTIQSKRKATTEPF